ncbi:MAG: ADP-ribosylglycohydrolase family protein [Dehalococcoidia bacterium]
MRQCRATRVHGGALSLAERAVGCLLGGAVGDAFGYAVEFDRLDRIRSRFGPDGIHQPVLTGGSLVVSDDTQMTLFTLEGLITALQAANEVGEDDLVGHLREAYLDWLDTQQRRSSDRELFGQLGREPALRVSRAPGHTCLSALSRGGDGDPGRPINDSKGCGAVMRVAPIGLFPRRFGPEEAFRLAARAGALTHGHPSGYLSAGALAAIVRLLADGLDLDAAARHACTILSTWDAHQETRAAIMNALNVAARRTATHSEAVRSLGEGWVGEEALAIGLYAALSATSFADAVRIAANHDGDSDSTASIAGQLWGAWHGLESIPHEWILDLDVLQPSLRLVRCWLRQLGDDEAAHARPR